MNTEALKDLNQFCCSVEFFRHSPVLFPRFTMTEGVKFLAENADCFWLLDKIASLQPKMLRDKMLQRIQFWTLKVNQKEQTAILICERDTNDVAYTEEIEYTDFPLPEIKLYVCPNSFDRGETIIQTALLPSEY